MQRADFAARTRGEESGVYGVHAVAAMIEHQPERIREILVDNRRATSSLAEFLLTIQSKGLRCQLVNRDLLDQICKTGHHQGVVARVKPFAYADVEHMCQGDRAALLLLDAIEDPRNLGAAARAAAALGATGLIIPKDRASQVTASAEHVAAGTLAQLPVARVANMARTLDKLKESGIWVVGAEADAKLCPWEVDFTSPVALIIGGENRGLRRLLRQRCDFVVKIPMALPQISLNAADAACVLLYEMMRQRQIPESRKKNEMGER